MKSSSLVVIVVSNTISIIRHMLKNSLITRLVRKR